MKSLLKKLVTLKLSIFTRWQLIISRPYVVAIIGTTNRSLVKDVVKEVLEKKITVLANEPQWNAEIGIPLTILRTNVVSHSLVGWFFTLWNAFFSIFRGGYPKVIIVEVAFNTPGDMQKMSKLLQPNAIVINDMQPLSGRSYVHEKEALEAEYLAMVKRGGKKDIVIINAMLPEKEKVKQATNRTVMEYSVDGNASYNAIMESGDVLVSTPEGKELFQTKIPGNAAKAAYAIASILKEKIV